MTNRIKPLSIRKTRLQFIRNYKIIGLISAFLLLINGCSEDIGENIYTFTGETVGEYLENRPEIYSEFTKMLELSEVMGLLKAYGKYTCFAPDNDAVRNLIKLKNKASVEDLAPDSIKKIVYDHIIKDFEVTTGDFVDGFISNLTMSGRYIKINFKTVDNKLVYFVNTTSTVSIKDIQAHNGIIHTLSEVLLPTENTLTEVIANNDNYSLFYDALIETGLNEKLEPVKDENYEAESLIAEYEGTINQVGGINHVPRERKYGFTALMPSNDVFAQYGITDLESMKTYAKGVYGQLFPQDDEISNPKDSANSLNRFIAYHLINKKISAEFFIERFDNTGWEGDESHSVKTVDMFEYIETMCPNTLMEVRTLRANNNEYNVFNMIESGKAVRLTDDFDNDAVNGVYHGIDGILAYTSEVDRMLSSKRLRLDAASFFPELVNNNMRTGHATLDYCNEQWIFPEGYIDRVKTSPSTEFRYINADDRFLDYQGDEVFLTGMYDFEITTLPIPAGTYEVRFGYQPTNLRGVAQLYWDGIPTGIPLDLTMDANDPKVGYKKPGTDENDPDGFENDKMMRNRGYMKAPACFQVIKEASEGGWYTGPQGRNSASALRRILGIYTFDEMTTHKFTVKAVKSGEFMFDYLEFVPIEVLEYEDIY
jgi:uncharacterized surface protein with fasciclin (FAS1) repeats